MRVRSRFNYFHIALIAAFAAGTILRMHMLSSQILLDDEWHGIIAALTGKGLWNIIASYNPFDNSSTPLNIYNYLVFKYFGLSELAVRLPSVLSGILSLILLPLALRKVLNEKTAIVFAVLLSVSPFLIFYSRFAKAYGPMMLLSFLALLQGYQWLTTGERTKAAWYVFLGCLAVYMHPFAVFAAVWPLVFALADYPARKLKRGGILGANAPAIKDSISVAVVASGIVFAESWPLLLKSAKLPLEKGGFTSAGLLTALSLQSGTANFSLNAAFYLLAAFGLVSLLRRRPVLGWLLSCAVCCCMAVLAITRPYGIQNGMVLLRYMIFAVPITLALVAIAFADFITRVTRQENPAPQLFVAAAGFAGVLFAAGPLSGIYSFPNNFANHSAYQGYYKRINWGHSDAHNIYNDFSVSSATVPPFYLWLKKQSDIKVIVEYPFDVCDFNDLFYYYQHFHKKRVIAGYCSDFHLRGYSEKSSATVGMLSADLILAGLPGTKAKFRNMVDVVNPASLSARGVDIIVFHKYIMAPSFSPEIKKGFIRIDYRSVPFLENIYQFVFGQPIYDDGQIVCFRIPHGGK